MQGNTRGLWSHQDGLKLRSDTLGSKSTYLHYFITSEKHVKCSQEAEKAGCQQVLWVFGGDQEITEVGAMNIFILLRYIFPMAGMMIMMISMMIMMMIMMMMIRNAVTGRVELVTPPLDSGTVLPGVTRQSVLDLAADMEGIDVIQRRITLPEVRLPSCISDPQSLVVLRFWRPVERTD